MTIEELHRTVVDGFGSIEKRFNGVDERFARIDERFVGIDERFARIDERFVGIDERFARMDERFDRMDERFDPRIREEHETTRRHFDVMVEKIEAAVRVVAEGHIHLRTVLDNHEVRLQAIEKRE